MISNRPGYSLLQIWAFRDESEAWCPARRYSHSWFQYEDAMREIRRQEINASLTKKDD